VAKQLTRRRSSLNPKGPSHASSLWAGALSILLLSLICAIRLLGDHLYEFPGNPDLKALPEKTVVICLAGGKFRVEAAYSLFAQGVGEQLLIIGAGKKSTAAGLGKAHAEAVLEKISAARFAKIQVETESQNTIENAFAVSRFLQQNPEVSAIMLITSGYHMRRAQMMIENQAGRSVTILPYTPPSEAIGPGNWWHTWLGIQVTTVEYFKLVLTTLLLPHLKSI
jgi:uncharacterized SAM-binding protein YcdF (DUF218 family)